MTVHRRVKEPEGLAAHLERTRADLLTEARETVAERGRIYGHVRVNAEVWARIAAEATGLDLQPEHYPVVMVAAKLARLRPGWHRDSWLDIAGYAQVAEMIEEDSGGLGCSPFTEREKP